MRRLVSAVVFAAVVSEAAAEPANIACHPAVSDMRVVASAAARKRAAGLAQPALSDHVNGFAWPDSPLGVARTEKGLVFFGSDGGAHMGPNASPRHGSVVRTIGTLDNPLGVEPPRDEQIGANPDPSVNPAYRLYSYLGGGPVFRVPTVAPYGHDLLMVTHGEIRTALTKPKPSFYSTLGLAASTDDGKSWTDLGEIIRPEHPYEPDMPGFEDGDPPLASSADGKYLMVFYHDLRGHGAWRPQDIVQLAVARAAVSDVVGAAFGDKPHAAQFRKFFNGVWTEPGVGGRASNLAPSGMAGAERQVAYDPALRRYLMVVASPASIALSESVDALHWSSPTQIADFRGERHAIYTSLVGIGQNPGVPDDTFSIFYTWYPTDGASWMGAELRRLTVQCR